MDSPPLLDEMQCSLAALAALAACARYLRKGRAGLEMDRWRARIERRTRMLQGRSKRR